MRDINIGTPEVHKVCTVGRLDGWMQPQYFDTVKEGEEFVATTVTARDSSGVEAGEYYIDAPEAYVNGLIDKEGNSIEAIASKRTDHD